MRAKTPPVLAAAVLSLITREGFDIRVSNMGGALGAGAYFAQHLSYSLQYINRVWATVPSCLLACQRWMRLSSGRQGQCHTPHFRI